MNKEEIVRSLAEDGVVEEMCRNIAHVSSLTPDLEDLAQSVYLILLEYDEAKLVDLWESDALGFFIARIIANQYLSKNSPFYKLFKKFRSLCVELNPQAYDEDQEVPEPGKRSLPPWDKNFFPSFHPKR